ncbi:hypothetical protein AVEN_14105-1 [Araneus ventricosus]|uniref:PiggyBac transposable element-derived protein domain-containing protein n=1 Tax=Araneus ventricosus TaxID=182803 RepID=A0A4Y2UUH5_ARAVE|nr:hypothetical protein AVEN_14105-1 [Araneus ventricosus]
MPRYRNVLTQEEINKVLFEDTDESDLDLSDEDGELDMSNTFQAADSSTLLENDSDNEEDVEDCKYERQKINLTLGLFIGKCSRAFPTYLSPLDSSLPASTRLPECIGSDQPLFCCLQSSNCHMLPSAQAEVRLPKDIESVIFHQHGLDLQFPCFEIALT